MQMLRQSSANGVGGPYSDAQVLAQLTAGVGQETWLFDRLDRSGRYLADITHFVQGGSSDYATIVHDVTADVKRTGQVYLRGDATLNVLSDFVRGRYQIRMPDGGMAEWRLGTFTCLPGQDAILAGGTWRPITLADPSQLLVDGGFLASTTIKAGSSYVAAVKGIVAGAGNPTLMVEMPDLGKALPADLTFDAGSTRLAAVNQLLTAINYTTAWWSGLTLRSGPIPDYNFVTASAVFDSTQGGSIVQAQQNSLTRQPDLSGIYNQFLLKAEASAATPFSAYYQITDPRNPIAIDNWHPKLYSWTDSTVADQASANAAAKTQAQLMSGGYQAISVDSFAWPVSEDNDVYQWVWQTQDEPLSTLLYREAGWSMKVGTGLATTHTWMPILPT